MIGTPSDEDLNAVGGRASLMALDPLNLHSRPPIFTPFPFVSNFLRFFARHKFTGTPSFGSNLWDQPNDSCLKAPGCLCWKLMYPLLCFFLHINHTNLETRACRREGGSALAAIMQNALFCIHAHSTPLCVMWLYWLYSGARARRIFDSKIHPARQTARVASCWLGSPSR